MASFVQGMRIWLALYTDSKAASHFVTYSVEKVLLHVPMKLNFERNVGGEEILDNSKISYFTGFIFQKSKF